MMRDLGFAFNDKDFSDRILYLEVVTDSLDLDESYTKKSNKKRKTEVAPKDKEHAAAASENHSDCSTHIRVTTLHINSAILAGSSPFFYKLFKNGMKESQESTVTIRIDASEEEAVMDLLNFMYSNTLRATSASALLDVLTAADKYQVRSCVNHCRGLFTLLPNSLESATLYLDYPSTPSSFVGDVVDQLVLRAKNYIVHSFGDVTDFMTSEERKEEALALPLAGIEAILRNSEMKFEDDVYHLIVEWGQKHLPEGKERRKTLTMLAHKYLYFPYLSLTKLKEIQASPDFNSKQISDLIMESLYLNSGYPYAGGRIRLGSSRTRSLRRQRCYFPIKEVKSGTSHLVFLNIPKVECSYIHESSTEGCRSMTFYLGKQRCFFVVQHNNEVEGGYLFGLYVQTMVNGAETTFDFEVSVLKEERAFSKSRLHYELRFKSDGFNFPVGMQSGVPDLFGMPWYILLDTGSYFIDGILYIKCEFKPITNSM